MSAHVGGADEIFTGTLVAIADPPRGLVMTSSDPITYIVAVEGVYRGDVGDTAEFQSAMSGASCGLAGMVVGRRYLVFVSIDGSSRTASLCGGTTRATRGAVQAVEPLTGTPMHPEIDGNEEQASAVLASAGRGVGGWQIGASAWAVGVAGFVAAAALVGALSRRRAIVRR